MYGVWSTESKEKMENNVNWRRDLARHLIFRLREEMRGATGCIPDAVVPTTRLLFT